MRLTCPGCGVHGSIEAFSVEPAAKRLAAIFAELPPEVLRHVTAYLRLFSPMKRGLSLERACDLAAELRDMVKAGQVENYGRPFPASPALFGAAMFEMVENRGRLRLPLKTHGYLISIVVGGSGAAAAATEEQAEQHKRQDSQARHRQTESQEELMLRRRRELLQSQVRAALPNQK